MLFKAVMIQCFISHRFEIWPERFKVVEGPLCQPSGNLHSVLHDKNHKGLLIQKYEKTSTTCLRRNPFFDLADLRRQVHESFAINIADDLTNKKMSVLLL